MEHSLLERAKAFLKTRRRQKAWYRTLYGLAGVVIFVTTYMLILPAITMERPAQCGIEEHAHTEECYETVPACTTRTWNCKLNFPGMVIHTHDDSCCDENGNLVCQLPEIKEHVHTAECYATEKTLICDQIEGSGSSAEDLFTDVPSGFDDPLSAFSDGGHTHTEACWQEVHHLTCALPEVVLHVHGEGCYDEEGNLICTQPEVIAHQHTDECFDVAEIPEQQNLICGKEEHIHTEACYPEEEDIFVEEVEVPEEENNGVITIAPTPTVGAEEAEDITETPDENNIELTPTAEPEPSEIPEEDGETSEGEETEDSTVIQEVGDEKKNEEKAEQDYSNLTSGATVGKLTSYFSNIEENEVMTAGVYSLFVDDDVSLLGDSSGVDFGDYITVAHVYTMTGEGWQATSTVKDGDQIKVSIDYTLPANTVDPSNKIIYYQMPTGITPLQQETGPVYHDGIVVGSYVISTDGLITITFNDAFADGAPFWGEIHFEGTASSTSGNDKDEVVFGGNGGTVTIEKKQENKDINIAKSGKLKDSSTAEYSLTVSTEKGTPGTVTITDIFKDLDNGETAASATGDYKQDTFVIKKIDANGNESTISGYSPTITTNNGKETFVISDLPALEANEKYVVTYEANVTPGTGGDGSSKLSNVASASSEGEIKWSGSTVDVQKKMIYKGGSYDSNTGLITWNITVNEEHKDIKGYNLVDVLPSGCEIQGDITIRDDSTWQTVDTITADDKTRVEYTFMESTTKQYTFIFKTTAPNESIKVSNTGTFGEGDSSYSSTGETWVSPRDWNLSKTFSNESIREDGAVQYNWQSDITLPQGALTELTYEDVILPPVDKGTGETVTGEEKHYAILGELDNALKNSVKITSAEGDVKFTNNQEISFAFEYFSDQGFSIPVTDSTAKVRSFKVTVKPAEGSSFVGWHLYMQYGTIVDYQGMIEGATWIFKNNGSIPNHVSTPSHEHYKPIRIQKQGGAPDGNNYLQYSNDVTVDFDRNEKKLYYRLLLTTEASENGEINLTDHLPPNTSYIEGSLTAKRYNGDYDQSLSVKWNIDGTEYEYVFANNLSGSTKSDGDHDDLMIKLNGGYNGDGYGKTIVISYALSIEDDPYWTDLTHISNIYQNRVEWGNSSAEQSTTVNRDVKKVVKTGAQLKNANDEWINKIEYNVVINPAGLDLDEDSDTITLIDTVSLGNGIGGAYLDIDNVKLYQLDSSAENSRGAEFNSSVYKVQYEESNRKITVTLPDALACVLVYQYEIDPGTTAGGGKVNNNVSLMGNFYSSWTTALQVSSSGSTVGKANISIYKVDSKDYSKLLPGAKFKLEKKEKATGSSWVTVSDNIVTDISGKLYFDAALTDDNVSSNNFKLEKDCLYRLEEVEAPVGYVKNTTSVYYFVYTDMNGKSAYDKWVEWENEDPKFFIYDNNKIYNDKIHFYGKTGGTLYISNEFTGISVKKEWVDSEGHKTNPKTSQVEVQLYQHTQEQTGHRVTVNLVDERNTSHNTSQTLVVVDNGMINVTLQSWQAYLKIEYDGVVQKEVDYKDPLMAENQYTGHFTIGPIQKDVTVTITNIIKEGYDKDWNSTPWSFEYDKQYSDTGVPTAYGDKIILNAANNWTYTWGGLPTASDDGKRYSYSVVETPVDGCTTSYSSSSGITTGDIIVTNTVPDNQGFELPETGGPGTYLYTLGGLLLAGYAGLLLYIQNKRRKGDRRSS